MDRIIIVDDEVRQCRGVKNILLRRCEDMEVEAFTSAQDALAYMQRENVKIIITDICMPDMDGLSLTERIRSQDGEAKVILLTGYAEFEYARRAISLGAFEYLLKPLNPDRLQAVIERAREELRAEQLLKRQQEQVREKLDVTLPVYMEMLFNQWVYGRLSAQELAEVEEIIPAQENGFVLAARFPGLWESGAFQDKNQAVQVKSALALRLREQIGRHWHCLSFFSTVLPDLMITVVTDKTGAGASLEEERAAMNRLLNAMERRMKEEPAFWDLPPGIRIGAVRVGVSALRAGLQGQIRCCYQEAVEVLAYGFYFPGAGILRADYILSHRAENVSISPVQEETVRTAVRRADGEGAVRALMEIWDFFTGGGYFPPAELVREFEGMVGRIAAASRFRGALPKGDQEEDCESFLGRVSRALRAIAAWSGAGREGRETEFVRKLRAYLGAHYGQELSLDEIAEHFSLTPSYCSALIREAAGSNFSALLLEIRMERARELLRDTDLKIYEIAMQTGYRDVKYFNRIFKRETGVTPLEYREGHKELRGGRTL